MTDAWSERDLQEPPRRAVVTPRVRTSPGSGALPIERVVKGFIDARARGVILVHAPPGGGKTTALEHLRRTLHEMARPPHLLDESTHIGRDAIHHDLTIATAREALVGDWLAVYELARWGEDEWIEYLAAVHRPMVASVMARLRDDVSRHALAGSPQLWTIVLDAMACDELTATAREALRAHVLSLLPDRRARLNAGAAAVKVLGCATGVVAPDHAVLSDDIVRLLRHPVVRLMLAADWLVTVVAAGGDPPILLVHPPERDLLAEAGAVVRCHAQARARLADLLRKRNRSFDAAAAGLLLAADPEWRPHELKARLLRDAVLDGAQWSGIDLRDACLSGASLRAASLRHARLDDAKLNDADCGHADFAAGSLRGAAAQDANFAGATFRGCDADGARFNCARFEEAKFESARLNNCDFGGANLTRAVMRGASLSDAKFERATIQETDLRDVTLSRCIFAHVDFRTALLAGTSFEGALLLDCNFEGIELPAANFQHARLSRSLFTGSRLQRANFNGAQLVNAGLADVDWPHADLRNADLRGSSFHLGSSRSGLVGSPIACEGSRTGFYTDDYNDQDFKRPEEIRKANLCGADLRGAKVDKVDFYLVDLRGAKYTQDQRDHFAQCGAILRSRVA